MGIETYPSAEYVTNAFSTDIKAEFKDDAEPRKVSVAGRMMTRRVMGKASFIELQDSKGRIQVYITRDDICPGESIGYILCSGIGFDAHRAMFIHTITSNDFLFT